MNFVKTVATGILFAAFPLPGSFAQTSMAMGTGTVHATPALNFAFGQPGVAAKTNRTVRLEIRDMTFTPRHIDARPGETIRFVIVNPTEIDHQVTIGDEATQVAYRRAMKAAGPAFMEHRHDPYAVTVKAESAGELVWRFTKPGNFEYDCNLPGHFEQGMKGSVTVIAP